MFVYTILLVDDEEAVRRSIRDLTPWEEHGFEILADVSNGYEALDIIAETVPDVLMTDIRMPYMDGIKLISEVRAKYSNTVMVIILSGYDEFTYAQTAMSLNVAEYVLKPVSVSSMGQVLSRAKARLDADLLEITDREKLEAFYADAYELYKEKFLISLVFPSRFHDEKLLLSQAESYGLSLKGEMFAVSIVDVPAGEFPAMAVKRLAEEEPADGLAPLSFVYEEQLVLIFASSQRSEFEYIFTRQINRYLTMLESRIVHYFTAPFNIGTGEVVKHIKELPESYKSATEALNYSSIYPEQHLISIGDVESAESEQNPKLGDLNADLVMAIKFGNEEELLGCVHDFFRNLTKTASVQMRTLHAMATISSICASYNRDLNSLLKDNDNLFTALAHANTAQRAEELIKRLALAARSMASGERERSHIAFVEKAKQLIKENYQNPAFGQEQVTNEIAVSPAYFSTTFKKETGISFVQYLTNVRVEKAKELLKSTDLKTYEIAERIGIPEPTYFSFIFKKNTGETPSHFRMQNR